MTFDSGPMVHYSITCLLHTSRATVLSSYLKLTVEPTRLRLPQHPQYALPCQPPPWRRQNPYLSSRPLPPFVAFSSGEPMLLKGKIRLPNTIVPRFPDRIKPPEKKKKKEDDDHDEGREEEELRTFQVGGGGGEERSEGEIWPDDGDENWTVLRAHHRIKIDIGREVSWDKRSDLEFEVASFLLTFLVLSCRLSMGFSFGPLISP